MSDDVTTPKEPAQSDAPYFRTYAKDLASLGGTAPAVNTPAPAKVEPKAVAPTPALRDVVPPPTPKAPEPELPPAYIIPNAPSTEESREAVLARLRAKANVPATNAPPAKIIPNAPSTNEDRQTILDRLHAKAGVEMPTRPVPQPPRIETPPPAPPVGAPDTIHTYKTDFSDSAKSTGASAISMLAQEQDAKGAPARVVLAPEKKNNLPMLIGGVALILLGSGSVFFAYQLMNGKPIIPTEVFVPSLIFADERARIVGSDFELQQALLALREKPMQEGSVTIAYITYATTTAKGVTTEEPATGGALIVALGLPAPEIVLRNVAPESTVGVIRAKGETRPFFILRVSSYERTFAGMLEWEKKMPADLVYLYPAPPRTIQEPLPPIATSTATTTSVSTSTAPLQTKPPFVFTPRFVDEVIENHDARVLRDEQGEVIMLYGYRDKATLVIARNEVAFAELLSRLSTAKTQ